MLLGALLSLESDTALCRTPSFFFASVLILKKMFCSYWRTVVG